MTDKEVEKLLIELLLEAEKNGFTSEIIPMNELVKQITEKNDRKRDNRNKQPD